MPLPAPGPDAVLEGFLRSLHDYRPGESWSGRPARVRCTPCAASPFLVLGPLARLPHEAVCAVRRDLHGWIAVRMAPQHRPHVNNMTLVGATPISDSGHALQQLRAAVWLALGRYTQAIDDVRTLVVVPREERWARTLAERLAREIEE